MKVTFRPTDWMTDRAMQYATDDLQANPRITAVFSAWDPGALAVKQAAKSLGLLDKLIIVGFDGDMANFKAIKAGEITATTRQQPYIMGQSAVEVLKKVFAGQDGLSKGSSHPRRDDRQDERRQVPAVTSAASSVPGAVPSGTAPF